MQAVPKRASAGLGSTPIGECRRCRPGVFRRVNRTTLLERTILTWLGFYPWECVNCRRKRFFRNQGRSSSTPAAA